MFLRNEKKWNIFNKETITFRLTLKYTLFIFITLIIMSATILFAVRYYVYKQSEIQLMNISSTIQNKLITNETITENDFQDVLRMNENIDFNIRKGLKLVFSTGENYNLGVPIDINQRIVSYEINESNLIYYNADYVNKQGDVFIIQTIKDMDNEREFIKVLFWILLFINGLAFCVSIVLGYLMSKRALSPINKIVTQAKKITVSDLSQRINIDGPDDELKRLSETFNELISRIEIGYEKQNRFALDASHELATPLAVVQGYLDIIGRWGKNNREVLEEAIFNMKKEVKNMTNLLDTLLFIAKGDNDLSKIEKKEFWLNELLVEIYKEAKLIYPDHFFKIKINQSINICADRKLIKQMIRAIIDNSVKYSNNDTTIQMSCKQADRDFQIVISDQGIGISEKDLDYIFDRFYRVDKARTREIGGIGLGLSIVKWIVDMHNGTIEVRSVVGAGTTIIVNIPI